MLADLIKLKSLEGGVLPVIKRLAGHLDIIEI